MGQLQLPDLGHAGDLVDHFYGDGIGLGIHRQIQILQLGIAGDVLAVDEPGDPCTRGNLYGHIFARDGRNGLLGDGAAAGQLDLHRVAVLGLLHGLRNFLGRSRWR